MKVNEFFPDVLVKKTFKDNNIGNFEKIWLLDIGWFEEKNVRRGGWSGVSRYEATDKSYLFIKRQQNHGYRAWNNFFIINPTFHRELENIQKFKKHGIPALDLLYYGKRKENGDLQAILVTKELEGFLPLDSMLLKEKIFSSFKLRKVVIKKIADVVHLMNENHLQHNCLYEKHIFVKLLNDEAVDIRLIDLEKVKWKLFKSRAMYRDLSTLYRHSEGWSKTDYLRFFLRYQNEHRLSNRSKKVLIELFRKVDVKVNKKHKL